VLAERAQACEKELPPLTRGQRGALQRRGQ
jgi:hypothetical protein